MRLPLVILIVVVSFFWAFFLFGGAAQLQQNSKRNSNFNSELYDVVDSDGSCEDLYVDSTSRGMRLFGTRAYGWCVTDIVGSRSRGVTERDKLYGALLDLVSKQNASNTKTLVLHPRFGFGNCVNSLSALLRLGLLLNRTIFYEERTFTSLFDSRLLSSIVPRFVIVPDKLYRSADNSSKLQHDLRTLPAYLDCDEDVIEIRSHEPLDETICMNPAFRDTWLHDIAPDPFMFQALVMPLMFSSPKRVLRERVTSFQNKHRWDSFAIRIGVQWRFCVDCGENSGYGSVSQQRLLESLRDLIGDIQLESGSTRNETLVFFTSDEMKLKNVFHCFINDIATIVYSDSTSFHNTDGASSSEQVEVMTDFVLLSSTDYLIHTLQTSFARAAAATAGAVPSNVGKVLFNKYGERIDVVDG